MSFAQRHTASGGIQTGSGGCGLITTSYYLSELNKDILACVILNGEKFIPHFQQNVEMFT